MEFKSKVSKELKHLREKVTKLSESNKIYQKTIEEMRIFFHKVNMIWDNDCFNI